MANTNKSITPLLDTLVMHSAAHTAEAVSRYDTASQAWDRSCRANTILIGPLHQLHLTGRIALLPSPRSDTRALLYHLHMALYYSKHNTYLSVERPTCTQKLSCSLVHSPQSHAPVCTNARSNYAFRLFSVERVFEVAVTSTCRSQFISPSPRQY